MLQHRCLNIIFEFLMKIEEAIKQKRPFRSNKQKATVNLMYTHGWWMSELRHFFKPFELTTQQFNILRILKGASAPLSTSDIRDRMLDAKSDITRIIDRMIKKGLVIKKTCSSDRRLVDVYMSKEGSQVLTQVNEKMEELDQKVSHLSESEAEQLSELLDKMRG